MEKYIYFILSIIFIGLALSWFILHKQDRRRLINGFMFFVSILSFAFLLLLIGIDREIRILSALGGLILLIMIMSYIVFYLWGLIILFSTGLKVIRKEGLSLSHLLSILLGLGIIGSTFILPTFMNFIKSKFLIASMGFFIAIFSYFLFGFIIYLTTSLLYGLWREKRNKDYIIVLGAGLIGDQVTPLLAARIDRAIEFYKSQLSQGNPPPKLLMSGGQGKDELISEAEAMKNYAIKRGLDPSHILIENKSTSTEENLIFSSKIIEKDSKKENPQVLFSTTNYHVLRAGIFSRKMGLDYNGIGAPTKFYYYVSALIREYIGFIYINRKINFIFATLLGLFSFANYMFFN